MAVENQADSMFAGDRHVMRWNGILDEDGVSVLDLTGRIIKFALTRLSSAGVPLATPLIDHRSDTSSQLTVPNPVTGDPHVLMELLPADTTDLAPRETTYHCELQVFNGSNDLPVVVATVLLTIKPKVVNA